MNFMNNILITGGTGRLAAELKKHLAGYYVGIEHFDLIYGVPLNESYDLIVHLAAYTDVKKAEQETEKCFMTNILGTFNLIQKYPHTPIIYISTEYAYQPMGIYAKTKRWAEELIKDHSAPWLVLRTSFKPNFFPFEYAYENQMTQGDEVGIIAFLLSERVKKFLLNFEGNGTMEFLGTGRKTILQLAKKSRPDVKSNKVEDYTSKTGAPIPFDYL
jgi:dTDP-4-dehydrorhamnose reductase